MLLVEAQPFVSQLQRVLKNCDKLLQRVVLLNSQINQGCGYEDKHACEKDIKIHATVDVEQFEINTILTGGAPKLRN